MANVCVSCPAPRRRRTYRRAPARRRVVRRRRAPARRSYRRPARPYTARVHRAPPQLTKFELAQVNPFDRRVIGVKIPDSNTQPSDTFIAEDRIAITSAATDLAKAQAFFPALLHMTTPSVDGVATPTSWTWNTAYATNVVASNYATDAAANFVGYRPCGHGIKISSPLAPTSATGFVHVCLYPMSTAGQATWELPVNISQMASLPTYRRFTLASLTQRSVTVVNKFIDITAQRYQDTDTLFANPGTGMYYLHFATSWCAVVVATESAPTAVVSLSVENFVHYEALPKFSSTLTQSSSPAANFNVRELQDVSKIASKNQAYILEGEENEAINNAVNALGRGASRVVGNMIDNYFGSNHQQSDHWIGGIPGVNDMARLTN